MSSGNCKHDQIMTQAHRENQQSRAKGASFAKEEQGNDGGSHHLMRDKKQRRVPGGGTA